MEDVSRAGLESARASSEAMCAKVAMEGRSRKGELGGADGDGLLLGLSGEVARRNEAGIACDDIDGGTGRLWASKASDSRGEGVGDAAVKDIRWASCCGGVVLLDVLEDEEDMACSCSLASIAPTSSHGGILLR